MLKVRRLMTEILLTVTNQEIAVVCKEEFQRHLRKHRGTVVFFISLGLERIFMLLYVLLMYCFNIRIIVIS